MNIIRNLLKPLSFLPAIFIMYLIFSFSAQDGITSAELSYKVSYKIIEIGGEILDADLQPWEIESYAHRFHGPVRKIAHMTEYFALAVAMSFPLYVYGLRGIWLMLVAGILCVGFACADEYHQSMVNGRSPSKKDVAIDSFGIFWGIVLVRIVGWTGRKTIFRPFCKKKKKNDCVYPDMPYTEVPFPNAKYTNVPYQNTPYSRTQYTNTVPSNMSYPHQNIHPNKGSANRPYNGAPGPYAPYQQYQQQKAFTPAPAPIRQPVSETSYSDSLSEDMSLKKLMHDIKDQKKAAYADMKQARKPSVDGTEVPGDDMF